MLVTSERSLLTVLLSAQQLHERIQRSFQTAVAELLTALPVPTQILNRELAGLELITFAGASNRSVIGFMNEFVCGPAYGALVKAAFDAALQYICAI